MVPKRLRVSDDEFVLRHVSEVKDDDVILVQKMQSSFLDSNWVGSTETPGLRLVEEPIQALQPHVFLGSEAINYVCHYI